MNAFWDLAKVRNRIEPGQVIASSRGVSQLFPILLEGAACRSTRHKEGKRLICSFYYPGDFVGLYRLALPGLEEPCEVQALTRCSIGMIERRSLERAIQRHPALGRALWRSTVIEIGMFRRHLAVRRRPALEQVADLLCEQLERLGVNTGTIPLTQVEIADATGLSAVQINRIFQQLREIGVLAKQRSLEVLNRQHLEVLAAFDAGYLNLGEPSSRWSVRIEGKF